MCSITIWNNRTLQKGRSQMEVFKKVMKILGIISAVSAGVVIITAIVIFSVRAVNAGKYKIQSKSGIDESIYIDINGIHQYINIRGEDISNPVMIFIHGGPGSPMGFAAPYYQRPIEKQFTVINYDQRGCGRTYFANGKSTNNLTVEQLESDLDAIVDYARKRFAQDKVVIMGHSWGTILGSLYAHDHSDKISAYIGVSQGVNNLYDGKIALGEKALAIAENENKDDAQKLSSALERMKQVQSLDDMNLRDLMTVSSLSAKYLSCGGEMSSLGQVWTGITSPYMNFTDVRWFLQMSDTDNFFASQEQLMRYAFFDFDLYALDIEYEFSVYYIVGSNDCAIPQEQTAEYYETVTAPDKAFVTIEQSGHSMFMDKPEEFAAAVLGFFE